MLIAPPAPAGPLSITMGTLLLCVPVTLSAALALAAPPSPLQLRV